MRGIVVAAHAQLECSDCRQRARQRLALEAVIATLSREDRASERGHELLVAQADEMARIGAFDTRVEIDAPIRLVGGPDGKHQLELLFQAAIWFVRKLSVDLELVIRLSAVVKRVINCARNVACWSESLDC